MTSRAIRALGDEVVEVRGPVMLDFETSGLYSDDGARVSTASIAFEANPEQAHLLRTLGFKVELESYVPIGPDDMGRQWNDPSLVAWCASIALPFDQGREGKPEGRGQTTLWDDAPNLGWADWQIFMIWLSSQELVFHNAKFDLDKAEVGVRQERWPGLACKGLDLERQFVWDTQLTCKILWPMGRDPKTKQLTTSLKPTCERYWGPSATVEAKAIKDYLKGSHLPPGRYDLIPWDILGPYADQDARLTWKLYWWQQQYLMFNPDADQLRESIQRAFTTMLTLRHMERRGVPYDSVASLAAAHELEQRAKVTTEKLKFYPATINAAKAYFFGGEEDWRKVTKRGSAGLELAPYETTPTGAPQMTAEIVERMVIGKVPGARDWADLQKINTAINMWYVGYADAIGADGRLRTNFRQNGTQSTRFSVERVNLQAIPHDYRLEGFEILDGIPTPRALIASAVAKFMPGWSIWELDLAQAELRVAAMWAGCTKMIDAITEGRDLHGETASELFDVDSSHPEWPHFRQIGKRGNFTLCFGAGAKTFQGMVAKETGRILEIEESADIVDRWNGIYPEYRWAIRRHSNRVESRIRSKGYGWVTLANGEKRYFTANEDTHKAFNQRVQGSLAQFAIDWMNQTEERLQASDVQARADQDGIGGAGLLLVIHDSQVLLLPDSEGEDIANVCRTMGEELWADWFPDVPGAIDMKKWSAK